MTEPIIHPLELEAGQRYTFSKRVPLMPAVDFDGARAAGKAMVLLQPGITVQITGRKPAPGQYEWYCATAGEDSGFINPAALFGAEIGEARE